MHMCSRESLCCKSGREFEQYYTAVEAGKEFRFDIHNNGHITTDSVYIIKVCESSCTVAVMALKHSAYTDFVAHSSLFSGGFAILMMMNISTLPLF